MKTWNDIAGASNAEILRWAESQSWARDMAACGQDAQWHAEGDVWTHTRMVFAAVERLEVWSREVISLSWIVNSRLLYLFALADTRGRHTDEMDRPEENLHLWKLVAEEHGCFDKPYAFANIHARFLFYRDQLSNLRFAPHEKFRCTVTLMSGLPGTGKDTWLARQRPTLPVVALDAIRDDLDVEPTDDQGEVIQTAREKCREHLRASRSFAFNATNITRQTRQRWIDLFTDYGARIEIVYLEPPIAKVLAQNKRRPTPVPEKVILRLLEKLEPPTITECHELSLS